MSLSVTYTKFNTEMVYENRNGTQRFYGPDTLGSSAVLLSSTGTVTDTYIYWPYGEIQSHVGSSVSPFTFVGTLGYYQQVLNSLSYVRANYLRQALGRWLVVDPLWPTEKPYSYALSNPVVFVDPAGTQQWDSSCKYQLPYTYHPGFWNSPYNQDNNNCYNYAVNDPGGDFRQPGQLSGGMYNNFPGNTPSCNNLIANSLRDGLVPLNPKSPGGCGKGWHKVCLFASSDDYHWWRQDPSGYWSSKPGHTKASNCYAGTNIPITDPNVDAPLHGYNTKCGCLCAKDLH